MTATMGSVALAFVLGLRHGLDADHLAAVDGLTRWNAGKHRTFAPYCGVLFSAGHSGAIFMAAVGLALLASAWAPPAWFGPVGALVSAVTLLLLGVLNLRAAFGASAERSARPIGFRASAFAPLLQAPRSWQVVLLGGLFALSFDAIALAALFAASSASGGVLDAGGVALAFAAGMLFVGSANGFWVMRLLRHSGDAGRHGARVMTLTVGFVALAVSAFVLLPLAFEPVGRWMETYDLVVSGAVITLVLAGYFGSLLVTHRARRGQLSGAANTLNILSR